MFALLLLFLLVQYVYSKYTLQLSYLIKFLTLILQ